MGRKQGVVVVALALAACHSTRAQPIAVYQNFNGNFCSSDVSIVLMFFDESDGVIHNAAWKGDSVSNMHAHSMVFNSPAPLSGPGVRWRQ